MPGWATRSSGRSNASLWLGHESAAVLAVVAAFFGGLAVGGLALGPRIERSARPVRWYAGCELVIALWSLLAALRDVAVQRLACCGDRRRAVAGVAMVGGVLRHVLAVPAGHRRDGRHAAGDGAHHRAAAQRRPVHRGALRQQHVRRGARRARRRVLVDSRGRARAAARLSASRSTCCAAWSALVVFPKAVETAPRAPAPESRARARGVLSRLALTGLLGIGYEVLVVRVLSQVTEDTVYTFAMLLAVYLVGTRGGRRRLPALARRRGASRDALGDRLLARARGCLPARHGVAVGRRAREGAGRCDALGARHGRRARRRGGARARRPSGRRRS